MFGYDSKSADMIYLKTCSVLSGHSCLVLCSLWMLKVVKNFPHTEDFPMLIARLHHFFPSMCGLKQDSLCASSPGPRFHYSELHKQITDALLKRQSCLLIDNECRLDCLFCTLHHVLLARTALHLLHLYPYCLPISQQLFFLWQTHTLIPEKHIPLSIQGSACSRSAPLSRIETLLIMQSKDSVRPDRGRDSFQSIGWLTLPEEVSYSGCATADAVRSRRLSNLGWFALTLTLEKRSR